MSSVEKVLERIDGYRDEVIQLQTNLTSRVALGPKNGGSGEHEKTYFIRDLLNAIAPNVLEEIKAPDERARNGYRPNLIAKWGESRAEPAVWVLSHSDIVPPGDLSLWESDPYQVRVEKDRIIGRGVQDNQQGFVSSYLAIKAIIESGLKLSRSVGLAIVADEETGSEYGLSYLLKHHSGHFMKSDLIIVPDAGDAGGTMIEIAEKSMLWLRFTVTGRQCHASMPNEGKNSLFGVAKLILALEELKRRFDLSDEMFSPPISTFEPTRIEANVPNVNTIPGRDAFYMDCRILPQYSVGEIIDFCREISGEVGRHLGLQIGVETTYRQDAAGPTSSDAPVVMGLTRAIKKVTGKDARPMGIGGGTVAAFFRKAGLPAAVWSTTTDSAHKPNEYCLISNVITDAKIFACLYLSV
ncbi:MAG: M20 family metallo-hydrolase [Thermodesulfobacteriota bacterium]|nr:M20 family metallo-hydrolase [Thermodesulfobacteriota bacterium]